MSWELNSCLEHYRHVCAVMLAHLAQRHVGTGIGLAVGQRQVVVVWPWFAHTADVLGVVVELYIGDSPTMSMYSSQLISLVPFS